MISAPMALAQKFFNDNELLQELRGGHNAAFGHFVAASLQTLQKFDVSIVIEVTCGIHGGNRLGGNAVADIVVFGQIAGTSAANYISLQ